MCGIAGYIGYRQAQPVILKALKRLEYRGYDSCGMAILGKALNLFKDKDRVNDLQSRAPFFEGNVGIGHTRWATHGEPSVKNAHPHVDCTGKIAVVHNGVITNYQELKDQLISEGHRFTSETDTEVIPHLIEKYYGGDFESAVKRAVKDLMGSYALAIISENHQILIACKKGSPLVIGKGDGETMVASDLPAILDYTNRVIYLEDDELAVITDREVAVEKNGLRITKAEARIDWCVEDVDKGQYEHFMLKEIFEQPEIIQRVADKVNHSQNQAPENFPSIKKNLDQEILIFACGSSYHAGLVGKYLIEDLLNVPVRIELASEVNHRQNVIPAATAIAITQSGETADVLISMKRLKEAGSQVITITNVKGSTACRLASQVLFTEAGPELSVAATKSFVAQLMALYQLVLTKLISEKDIRDDLILELQNLSGKVRHMLEDHEYIKSCAFYLSQFNNVFFIGRGINQPIALEGALKLKEISYIHAEGFAAGELKHGPFSLLQEDTPVVAIINRDFTREAMITNIKEVKSRKSPVIALIKDNDPVVEKIADFVVQVPATHYLLSPVVNVVALQ
ncbi:MAG: glutamine--fructose-6-phosphate transaminase (isomerizing) [Dehalococcoidales bacterium]|nr:glutamine--fructose-6-phosphate transaminase (isomerizing) [Dehalococcoidales bacterium]